MIKVETLCEVVEKVIGPVMPVGESRQDDIRYENLKMMAELVERLVRCIDAVGMCDNRVEYSMNRAGKYATKFLTESLGISE